MANTQAIADFMREFNSGKDVEVSSGSTQTQYTPTTFGINKVEVKAMGEEAELVFSVKVLDGDNKDREFEVTQKLFFNDDGTLSSPVRKSYTNKAGIEKASTLAYDILDSARADFGDDRFGQKFSVAQYKGLKFKMGYKHVQTSKGEYDFLETNYQKLKDKENYDAYKSQQESSKGVARTVSDITEADGLPF